jgi:hypothetical protein
VTSCARRHPTRLIPAIHQEADQITFFFELLINGKAPLALVFPDVRHDFVSTSPAEFWAQRQIKCAAQNRLNLRRKIPRSLFNPDYIFELKHDGLRAIAYIEDGESGL